MDISVIGLALIIISWIPEIDKTIISKKANDLDIKFVFLYFSGSLILFYHAIKINDVTFSILNGLLSLMALLQLFVLLTKVRK